MTRKKSGFLTFIFSLLPGAGEMYMGFMKQGISLMGLFWLIIFFGSLGVGPLLFVLPIIWFYSFFHVHNLHGMSDEEFYAVEDDFLFHLDTVLPKGKNMDKKYRMCAAAVLIVMGVAILWGNFTDLLYWWLPYSMKHFFHSITYSIPRLLVSVLLILGGIWLIRGKKRQLDESEEKKDGDIL